DRGDDLWLCLLGQAQVRATFTAHTPLYGTICGKDRRDRQIVRPGNDGRRMLHPLSPDRVRRIHGQPELRAFVPLGKRVAAGAAGETALRTNGEPLRDNILRRFIDAPSQAIDRFEDWRFATDQTEHDALLLWDKAQRRKVACARRVIFEQEMVRLRARKKALRDPFVTTVRDVTPPEIAAAHMDADHDLAGTPSERGVDGIDVTLDQRIGVAA